MSQEEEKRTLFNKISSLRTDANSKVKNGLKEANEFIKNNDKIQFLLDLLATMDDVNAIKQEIIDSVHKESEEIEKQFKQTIVKALNDIVFCYSEATTPSHFISEGVTLKVAEIDFNQMLKIDPMSDVGSLIYMNQNNGLLSTDFNTFLYNVITTPDVYHPWGPQVGVDILLEAMFKNDHVEGNDILTIKINSRFQNVKFANFFREFITSMDLIDTKTMMNNLYDSVVGTVSFNSNKTLQEITDREEINEVIEKIMLDEEDKSKIDSFFEFNNKSRSKIEDAANGKLRGVFKTNESDQNAVEGRLSLGTLKRFSDSIDSMNNIIENEKIITDALNALGTFDINDSIPISNIPTINYKFVTNMVKNMGVVMSGIVLSPKIVIPFMLALKMSGLDENITDVKTFVKKNGNVFKNIVKSLNGLFLNNLTEKVTRKINTYVKEKIKKIKDEQLKNRKAQIDSLKPDI